MTREEMIKLISNLQQRIAEKLEMYDEYDDELWGKADAVIEALSEAKPAMAIEIERDPKYGGPSLEVLRFDDLGDRKHHLFAVPCSPAKAKDTEGWGVVPDTPTPSMTLQGALAGVSHGNGKFSQKGAESVYKAMLASSPAPDQHPDDAAVDSFAAAMKAKLAEKRSEGRGGWNEKEQCSQQFLTQQLRDHVDKGDPVDVGNFAMMLHQRGESISPAPGHRGDDNKMAEALEAVMELIEPTWPVEIDIMKSAQSVLESYRREKEKTEQ